MNPNYPFVAGRAAHRCEYCHAPEVIFNTSFEVDHILPLHRGGEETPSNWALACRACNLWKSDAITAIDTETQTQISLFNPRVDVWEDNFIVESQSPFHLVGVTAVGRATIDRLKMNAPYQLTARAQWLTLGLYP
jgi:hypothetical protein